MDSRNTHPPFDAFFFENRFEHPFIFASCFLAWKASRMAAAAAHAHAQHKRGDANGSHLVNPLMTALMQDDSLYGTEVRRRSWLEKVFIALRGPLHEVEQSHVAQMHDFWSARDAADDTKEDYFSEARARAARARSTRARAATTDAVSSVASDHLLHCAPPLKA